MPVGFYHQIIYGTSLADLVSYLIVLWIFQLPLKKYHGTLEPIGLLVHFQ